MPVEIKTIGSSGRISPGKKYAGRTVTVEEMERGVWVIKTAEVIPDNEMWLHSGKGQVIAGMAIRLEERTLAARNVAVFWGDAILLAFVWAVRDGAGVAGLWRRGGCFAVFGFDAD